MAEILNPAEFKRVFEKAERYPLAFVEVKKLDDTKNLIKRAKDARGILEVEKKIAQQLVKTRATLQNWERGLSPQFKQMFGSRRVMKSMDDEKRINDRNLAESTQRVGVEANIQKKAGNAQGQLKQLNVLLDKSTKGVREFEEFRKLYDKATGAAQGGSLPMSEIVSLDAKVKPLAQKSDELVKMLKKLEKDYSAIAEADHAESMDKFAQAKLKDSQQLVEKLLARVEKCEISKLAQELKGARKGLSGDKDGWMELVKKFVEQGTSLTKLFPDTTRLYDQEIAKLGKVKDQYPHPKAMTNAKPADFTKQLQMIKDFRKTQIAANDAITKKLVDMYQKHESLRKQVDKLLKTEFYVQQNKADKQVGDAGKDLEKAAANHRLLRQGAEKRVAHYNKTRMEVFGFLQERSLDYENELATAKLKEPEKKK